MILESLIKTYGYLAIIVGTFLEGETILIVGGFIAHRGYLELPWVILAAFVGSLGGDQLFFYLGRKHSEKFLGIRPSWKARIDKAERLLARFRTVLILTFRLMYSLRAVLPFVIGMSKVPTKQFILLNGIGAVVWAVVVGTAGYLFGEALEAAMGNIKRYEFQILGTIVLIGALIWAIHFCRGRS